MKQDPDVRLVPTQITLRPGELTRVDYVVEINTGTFQGPVGSGHTLLEIPGADELLSKVQEELFRHVGLETVPVSKNIAAALEEEEL